MARQWFIFKAGEQSGPMATEELKRKATSGELEPNDWVRPDDRQEWFNATAVKGLRFASSSVEGPQQTVPPPPPIPNETATPTSSATLDHYDRALRERDLTDGEQKAIGSLVVVVFALSLFAIAHIVWPPRTPEQIQEDSKQWEVERQRQAEKDHVEALRNYKSTKPLSQMDGQERHEYNEAWKYMSDEEKKKQIRRDFGDLPE
jgi:hypothetical protein